ncbi:MAG: hypothetical protein Q7S77_00310 [Candidatus Staskawiczbacteria bacterium]|nr:hypothetical protein [Candidatus Staskawiczbacteria bacterium]
MRITKCDLCKKEIKDNSVTAGIGLWPKAELCQDCGSPILKFLKKHKFIKDEKKEIKLS